MHIMLTWKTAGLAWVGAGALKACMVAAYRSTDFEVHRNWFAITASLPLSRWYYEDTSEWTLDYPPLFAWFQRLLGLLAPLFDEDMLRISAAPYESAGTILFQRLSVIVTELILVVAVLVHSHSANASSSKSAGHGPAIAVLLALNAGLFITDHVHFQYNGFLLGLLVLSATLVNQGRHLAAALLFSILLNMKHLFLALGPAYFVYLLRWHCLEPCTDCWNTRRSSVGVLARFSILGLSVLSIFALAWGPFVASGGLQALAQILQRLFPFGRGLCHAYWAPNVWVAYNLADKALIKILGSRGAVGATMTGGLVAEAHHTWLPRISPLISALLSLSAMLPALSHVWQYNTGEGVGGAEGRGGRGTRTEQRPCMVHMIAVCSLAAFLFG